MGLLCCLMVYSVLADFSQVKRMVREDPTQDIYENLDMDSIEAWSSYDYDIGITERAIQIMTPLEEVVQIQVVLVGFSDLKISPVSGMDCDLWKLVIDSPALGI